MTKVQGITEGRMICQTHLKEPPLCMSRKGIIARARGALPLARERHGITESIGWCGSDGLAHQSPRNIGY